MGSVIQEWLELNIKKVIIPTWDDCMEKEIWSIQDDVNFLLEEADWLEEETRELKKQIEKIKLKAALKRSDITKLWNGRSIEENTDTSKKWLIVVKWPEESCSIDPVQDLDGAYYDCSTSSPWPNIICDQFIAVNDKMWVYYTKKSWKCILWEVYFLDDKCVNNIIIWNIWAEEWINPEITEIAKNIFEQWFNWELSYLEWSWYFILKNIYFDRKYFLFDKKWKQFCDKDGNKEFDNIINNKSAFITISWKRSVINMYNWKSIICENIEKDNIWEINYDVLIKFIEKENFSWNIYKVFPYSNKNPWILSFIHREGEDPIYLDREGNRIEIDSSFWGK